MNEPWLPTRYTPPLSDDFVTDGDDLIRFANMAWTTPEVDRADFKLYRWQEWLLRHVLEKYPEDYHDPKLAGELRYTQVCISVSRQNGKSLLGSLLAVYLLLWKGGQVLSVANSIEQAGIIYRRVMVAINENPALRDMFRTSETRGISSKDFRRSYSVKPNKEAALQGLAASTVYDEQWLIKPENYAAVVLGTSAIKGVVYGISTSGNENSTLLAQLYQTGQDAIDGKPGLERFGFFIWQADENASVTDDKAILQANPTVAEGHMDLEQVKRDLLVLPEREAKQYRLNLMVAGVDDIWMPQNLFNQCLVDDDIPEGRVVFGIDRDHSWNYATVTAAIKREDSIHTQVVGTFVNPTKDQLLEICLNLAAMNPIGFFMEGYMLKDLAQDLQKHGLRAFSLSAAEVCTASSTMYALCAQERTRIRRDPVLLFQAGRGKQKYKGDHWRVVKQNQSDEIDALMSTIFAVYGASKEIEVGPQIFS